MRAEVDIKTSPHADALYSTFKHCFSTSRTYTTLDHSFCSHFSSPFHSDDFGSIQENFVRLPTLHLYHLMHVPFISSFIFVQWSVGR